MPETSIAPPSAPVSRPAKPVSEALLNEKVGSSFHSTASVLILNWTWGRLWLAMAERADWANVLL